MLLRLIAENITSFKEAVEFNTFPSSKSHSHENHKVVCGHATALRMSAIYGANGAGKSNLLQALNLLQTLVKAETLRKIDFYDGLAFRFASQNREKPSGLAIEFYYGKNIFYYHIEFSPEEILMEELLLSKKTKDIKLFLRKGEDFSINSEYVGKGITKQFQDALKRLVRPDMLLLSFIGKYYSSEAPLVVDAYQWFVKNLQLVLPNSKHAFVPHLIDTDSNFAELVNAILPELKTGIDKLLVKKELISEEEVKSGELMQLVKLAKEHPGEPQSMMSRYSDDVNVIYEDGNVYLKTLLAVHKNLEGADVEMSLRDESDGTRRLIDYMPLLYVIIQKNRVYVVDEIERSIHPIVIKEVVRKLSESETAKGQLIFTTHESGLLDQNIFRPDEIWFAQKDAEQATQLYPLSDFDIHKTANIENGYLNGRYGGIPFLSNLRDLHW
ncbi:MAG: ATP-binding protein [Paludibacteraceae bacterium]|nr:ATP-binding protein [Paludibacteraceae bacterium]